MIIKKPETEFDKLINAARHKFTHNSARNLTYHRQTSLSNRTSMDSTMAKLTGAPSSINFATFFARADDAHELADSKFSVEPSPANSDPSPNHNQVEDLGNKRWKYQGKTYKEEPIGRS